MYTKRCVLAGTFLVGVCQSWSFALVESYGHGYVGSQGNAYGYVQMGPVNKVSGSDPVLARFEQWLQTGPLHETKADVVSGSEISGTWQMDRLNPIFGDYTISGTLFHGFGSSMSCRIITNDDLDDSLRLVWLTSINGELAALDSPSWPVGLYASANYWGGADDLGAYDIQMDSSSQVTSSSVNPRYQRHWLLLFEPGTTSNGGRLLTYRGGIEYGETITSGVPEPASLAVLGIGALGMLLRRRKR